MPNDVVIVGPDETLHLYIYKCQFQGRWYNGESWALNTTDICDKTVTWAPDEAVLRAVLAGAKRIWLYGVDLDMDVYRRLRDYVKTLGTELMLELGVVVKPED